MVKRISSAQEHEDAYNEVLELSRANRAPQLADDR